MILTPERVADLEQVILRDCLALRVHRRTERYRETLLALIADWRRSPHRSKAAERNYSELCKAQHEALESLAGKTSIEAEVSRRQIVDALLAFAQKHATVAESDARRWKDAAEANRGAAMGYQDRALRAEQHLERKEKRARLEGKMEQAQETAAFVALTVKGELPLTQPRHSSRASLEQWIEAQIEYFSAELVALK